MKVLIGTTNPSKVRRFSEMLDGSDIEFLTLSDLGIADEPTETGDTPEENARIKAEFYGKYFDRVICNDSGLYFDSLPLDDARQPGLNIRTPAGHERLGELPESEMKAVRAFDTLPENLTYPQVTPRFFKEAEELFRKL